MASSSRGDPNGRDPLCFSGRPRTSGSETRNSDLFDLLNLQLSPRRSYRAFGLDPGLVNWSTAELSKNLDRDFAERIKDSGPGAGYLDLDEASLKPLDDLQRKS